MISHKLTIVLAVAATLIVAYRFYMRKTFSLLSPTSTSNDLNQFMPELADRAVKFVSEHGNKLDYSFASIKVVELELGKLHDLRIAKRLSDRELHDHAMSFGAYIGEIIRRKYGGTWKTDHSIAGPDTFPMHWNDHESFPVGWCGKRMLNGEEDNVWFKFQLITSDNYLDGKDAIPNMPSMPN